MSNSTRSEFSLQAAPVQTHGTLKHELRTRVHVKSRHKLYSWAGVLLWLATLSVGFDLASAQQHSVLPSKSQPLVLDTLRREVRVLATYQPQQFAGWFKFVPNYHLLVWSDGRAAGEALFAATVSDTELVAALAAAGGIAGNNLTMAAWDKRHDPEHPAPQSRIAGTPVEIRVGWEGAGQPLPLAELLKDPGGKGFDFRFGGNRALIPHWHSGCLVCLYSCPGSKVGNAAYTVRDYVTGATKFEPLLPRLPQKGTQVVIYFRIL